VQLALTPDGRWDFATADLVSAASAAGFTAVGINGERVDAAAVEAYAEAGVRCHELLAFVVGDDESDTMTSAERLADHARTIGAEWVLTVFTASVLPLRIQHYAKLFDDAGVGMAVEYTPLGAIPSIRDGMEVVRAANRGGHAGLMVDSWHFCFSDNTWDDLAAVSLDDIAYLQFTDALEPELSRPDDPRKPAPPRPTRRRRPRAKPLRRDHARQRLRRHSQRRSAQRATARTTRRRASREVVHHDRRVLDLNLPARACACACRRARSR
jgi:sugar phosphate isomerase/epimerase